MKKNIFILFCLTSLLSCRTISTPNTSEECSCKKYVDVILNIQSDTIVKQWYIPSAEVAAKIAEAVWLPIYGDGIYSKLPLKVRLRDGVWIVDGSLPYDMDGGVPHIEINGADGKISNVYHSK